MYPSTCDPGSESPIPPLRHPIGSPMKVPRDGKGLLPEGGLVAPTIEGLPQLSVIERCGLWGICPVLHLVGQTFGIVCNVTFRVVQSFRSLPVPREGFPSGAGTGGLSVLPLQSACKCVRFCPVWDMPLLDEGPTTRRGTLLTAWVLDRISLSLRVDPLEWLDVRDEGFETIGSGDLSEPKTNRRGTKRPACFLFLPKLSVPS